MADPLILQISVALRTRLLTITTGNGYFNTIAEVNLGRRQARAYPVLNILRGAFQPSPDDAPGFDITTGIVTFDIEGIVQITDASTPTILGETAEKLIADIDVAIFGPEPTAFEGGIVIDGLADAMTYNTDGIDYEEIGGDKIKVDFLFDVQLSRRKGEPDYIIPFQ